MNPRWAVFREASLLAGDHIRVLETGVSDKPADGMSTVYWSQDPNVRSSTSIDLSMEAFKKLALPDNCFLEQGHSVSVIASQPDATYDLVYLDSDMDPVLIYYEALAALPKLRYPGVILVDDAATKGRKVRSLFNKEPQQFAYKPYGSWRLVTEAQVFERRPVGTLGMLLIHLPTRPEFR